MAQEPSFGHRFVVEAREHLSVMTSAMIALERNEGGAHPAIEQLLRAAHSIKGGAGFTGLRKIEQLAHAMEDAIEKIRDGKLARSPEAIDALLVVLDRIAAMVDDFDHSNDADISEALARLRPIIESSPAPTDAPVTALAAGESAPPRSNDLTRDFTLSSQVLTSWQADSSSLYGIEFDWYECERQFGLSPHHVTERLERAGATLESQIDVSGPSLREGQPVPPMWHRAVIASPLPLKQFTDQVDIPCARIVLLREKTPIQELKIPPTTDVRARPAPVPTSLRVSVPLVDKMMALAGELVLVRNQAMRSVDPGNAPLGRLLRRLDSVTNELQDAALRIRTQPVGTLFDRFPRVVRDLSRQLGKQIDVEITGSEVELDKTILELLADPLTHLIRNCCDHGIEAPDQRTRAGKPAAGRIKLSARQERGQIVVEIRDDGRGIDPLAVKRKAREQGIKREDELARMNERQVYDLILLSGFSTAAQVTDVSGRGVGMDVVKTNLDQIGGVVEIDSAMGTGTVFTLRLPLTLAIMPCLLIGSEGQTFGVPQRDVEEILLLDSASPSRRIERSHEGDVLRWRGRLLSVIRLREVLRPRQSFDAGATANRCPPDESASPESYAAVLSSGSRRFVLVFDEVVGSENIVVKPLHPMLKRLSIYGATTILGEGSVALVLNTEGIARHGGILERPAVEEAAALPGPENAAAEEAVLLFRSGRTELLAVKMEKVRRVVMITPDRIERIGDRELVNVDNIATDVLRLDRLLNVSPCVDSGRVFLILPRDTGSPLGILVSDIVDTPAMSLQLDNRAFKADGVLGTAMIRGEIAVFIDIDRVIGIWEQMQHPARASLPNRTGKRILVVDDTQFFQKLVSESLRGEGHEVQVAGNGSEGLNMLRTGPIDLVICDIEMPVMDGLEFARQVRADQQLSGTPLIALTTLNTQQSRDAAMAAGFDGYEVKLDRQTLLASVNYLLERNRRLDASNPGAPAHA